MASRFAPTVSGSPIRPFRTLDSLKNKTHAIIDILITLERQLPFLPLRLLLAFRVRLFPGHGAHLW
jgi:hypothetical protein